MLCTKKGCGRSRAQPATGNRSREPRLCRPRARRGDWELAVRLIACGFTSFYVLNTLNDVCLASPMTYDAFVAELARAGLTIREFASLLGMRPNSITNNRKRGEVPDHLAVIAALLSELRLSGVPAAPVFARLGLTKKKPRGAATIGRFAGDKQGTLELRS